MTWRDHVQDLLRRAEEDQAARVRMLQAGVHARELSANDPRQDEYRSHRDAVKAVDARNREWLGATLKQEGSWPTLAEVGLDAIRALWILAQHADRDPELQERCLELMTALPPHEAPPFFMAALTDRVLLNTQGTQRFGTQWKEHDGEWNPRPLESPAQEVDRLRAEIGLESLEEYRGVIEQHTR